MIVPAKVHEAELITKMRLGWYNPRYQYFTSGSWREEMEVQVNDWQKIAVVSVRSYSDWELDNNLVGYMSATVNRDTDSVSSLSLIKFPDGDSTVFAQDFRIFMKQLMQRFRKISWSVIIGNPVEPHYDKLCLRIGGRIVGCAMQEARLLDGTYADLKMYEWVKNV